MTETTRIMVPLDGSEKDARALAVASALADLSGGALHLVHVLDATDRSVEARAAARAVAEERLATSGRQFSIDAPFTWAVLDGSHVVEELVRHAAARDALAVVMGTRAPSAVGRVVVGSVADQVVRECPRPVVLVPPGAAFMAGRQVRFGRVLVPLDGSVLSAEALEFLLRLPRAHELEYVLLEVVPPTDANSPAESSSIGGGKSGRVADAELRLASAAARVRSRGVPIVDVQVVEATDTAEAIVAAVRDCLVELIAMSTKGTGGLRRLVLGSVAEGVVRASEIPVLLLTPAALAAARQPT